MLKRENRLKSKQSFSATYRNSNSVSNDLIILYAGKVKQDKNCPTRVGFVVSKKIHKRAVKRNRIKRLIRENIRLMLKEKNFEMLNKFQSLIFFAKNEILEKDFQEIRNTILILLEKLAIKIIQ